MDPKGYYKILGLDKNASQTEIKSKYKKLALKFHPDRQANKSEKEKKEAETKFKEINEAYQVLSDEGKRANYDKFGNPDGGVNFGSNFSGFNFDNFSFNQFGQAGNGFDFRDIFSGFGGARNNTRKQYVPEPGTDIRMTIPVDINDIFTGCTKKVKYQRNVRCPNCHGSGGFNKQTCPECNGSGNNMQTKQTPFGYQRLITTCQKCHGNGYIMKDICTTCNGSGFKKKENIVEVTFQPGMLNGYAIKFNGMGNESTDIKGANGDFLAYCKHAYDTSRYNVNNNDVYENIYIPYYDALLGTEYILEKPDGSKKKINIPTCVEPNKMLKLFKEGIKWNDTNIGDYYIIINYEFPKELLPEESKALQSIKVAIYKNKHNINK